MSESNANSISDLTPEELKNLMSYIETNFEFSVNFAKHPTSYGLKQRYTRLHPNKRIHITTECFKEAMELSGFKSKQISNVSDYCFNMKKPKYL